MSVMLSDYIQLITQSDQIIPAGSDIRLDGYVITVTGVSRHWDYWATVAESTVSIAGSS